MNTIQIMLEALKTCIDSEDEQTFDVNLVGDAIAAGEAELRREPVGFLFQHETGRTRVVMKDDVMDADASWFKVGPLYLGEETK